jgi:hypothetical protein
MPGAGGYLLGHGGLQHQGQGQQTGLIFGKAFAQAVAQENKTRAESFEEMRPIEPDWQQIRSAIRCARDEEELRVWPDGLAVSTAESRTGAIETHSLVLSGTPAPAGPR